MEVEDINEPIGDTARSILNGLIVLSSTLACQNHYLGIDVSLSLSRLMRDIASDDQSEQIECQLCNNEASEPVKIKTFEHNYYLSSLLISGIEDKFISTLSKDFQSRAPPKI